MDDTPGSETAAAVDFLLRLQADREEGRVRALADYLELFPGREAVVAREWLRVVAGASDRSSAKEVTGRPDAPPETADSASAPRLGPYRILEELGRGGQAVVHLAEDTRLGRRVALKVLRASFGGEGEVLRFRREAEIASRLRHPGICGVHDIGCEDGAWYIAMPWLEGETLAKRLARGGDAAAAAGVGSAAAARERTADAVRLVEVCARALHAAHEAGVVHRDVKPANIMVAPDGSPVLLDFGLARGDDPGAESLSLSGDVFGTPAYMSPEQVSGKRRILDRRTDVWSLGVTLYEMLAGCRPFERPTRELLAAAILDSEPPVLRKRNRAVPPDLEVVVATALEKDLARRYRTAADFAEDLRRVREHEPIRARPAGALLRLRRWAERQPLLAAATGGIFVVLLAGLAATTWQWRAKSRALEERERASDIVAAGALIEREQELWPAAPDLIDGPLGLDAWLAAAGDVLSREPAHRAAFAALVVRGRPPSPEGGAGAPALAAAFDRRRTMLATELAQDRGLSYPGQAARRARLETAARALDEDLAALGRHAFDDPDDAALHARLVELLGLLRDLRAAAADVRERRRAAAGVRQRTVVDPAAAWDEALRAARDPAACPAYSGLALAPQEGLIPIGRDAESGLLEFWLEASGDRPRRDDATGRLRMEGPTGLVLVLVPGATFRPGSAPGDDPRAQPREHGSDEVRLDPFLISKYEMTQGQWLRAAGEVPSAYGPGLPLEGHAGRTYALSHPVEQVSWFDCSGVLRRWGLELPTEAQWEHAARAGARTPFSTGADPATLEGHANFADHFCRDHGGPPGMTYEPWSDGFVFHAPVGSFRPNRFGLHDTAGNVWEWVRDVFTPYAEHPALRDGDGLRLDAGRQNRIVKGGAFMSQSENLRPGRRDETSPGTRVDYRGVRPARALRP